AEPFLYDLPRGGGIEISGNDETRVRRCVVFLEEGDDILVAGGGQVWHVADDRPMIRMAFGVQHFGQCDLGHPVGPILVTLAPLVLDDVALGVHGLWGHRVEEVAHPIGLEKQRELQRVRWDVDPVVRAIGFGRAVVRSTDYFKERIEFTWLDVAGTHEHQVLEEVSESGTASPLACGANVVPHVDGGYWGAVGPARGDAQA